MIGTTCMNDWKYLKLNCEHILFDLITRTTYSSAAFNNKNEKKQKQKKTLADAFREQIWFYINS